MSPTFFTRHSRGDLLSWVINYLPTGLVIQMGATRLHRPQVESDIASQHAAFHTRQVSARGFLSFFAVSIDFVLFVIFCAWLWEGFRFGGKCLTVFMFSKLGCSISIQEFHLLTKWGHIGMQRVSMQACIHFAW